MNDVVALALLVVVVIAGSALASGVEAAILTVNPARVHELANRAKPLRGARRLDQLRQRLGRTLAVLVIANNGFNIFGSLMLGGYAAAVLHNHKVDGVALPLFSIGLTLLVILLGEILPKSMGSRFSMPVALASAEAVHWLGRLMLPVVLMLEQVLPAITQDNEISTNEDEIRLLARLGSQKGQIEADEAAMIAKVFQLNDLTARDLMVAPGVTPPPSMAGPASSNSARNFWQTMPNGGWCWAMRWMRCSAWLAGNGCSRPCSRARTTSPPPPSANRWNSYPK